MSGGLGQFGRRQQQGQGPANLWTGYSQTPWQQPRGQMPFMGGGFGGGRYQQGWPGGGYGGMPNRFGGAFGAPGMGMSAWGNPFGGFSGGYNPYGPGSYSAPGAMPYGGGSGMFGGGSYNMMANRMAAVPWQQMAQSRFSMPYQPVIQQQAQTPQYGGMVGRVLDQARGNPMNPQSGCYYDSSQDDYICPGR